MMPDKSQGGLLARLQYLSGCQYLSDLHSPLYREDVINAIRTVSLSAFSMEEWEEAFGYIAGVKMKLNDREELIEALIRRLESAPQ